jgi:hypothetical protein
MKVLPSHVLVEFLLFGVMALTALWGLAYAWWHWRLGLAKETLPYWRRILASVGLVAVSVQALLFVLSWTRIGRNPLLFVQWEKWLNPTFIIAVPAILAGEGTARWWLLSSSVLLFVMCYLFTLTA